MSPQDQIESWFLSYGDDVFRFLVYFKGTKDVEDLLQETFLRALRSYGEYAEIANPKTWLLRIARNLLIDESRRKKAVYLKDEVWKQQPSGDISPEHYVENKDQTTALMQSLGGLDEKYRVVLILRCLHDLSFKQIAELVGCNEVAARTRFHRAKKLAEDIFIDIRKGGRLA